MIVLGFGRSETCDDSELEEGRQRQNPSLSWRAKERAMYRTVVGKLLYMCHERADVMYSVKETARKITCPNRRVMSCEIRERRSKCKRA